MAAPANLVLGGRLHLGRLFGNLFLLFLAAAAAAAQSPQTTHPRGRPVPSLMGADKKSAGAALDAICGIITREVSGGGAVTLPGVGKIQCRERPERMVRNPSTGEQFKKPADKVVKMTIAKALKDSVNG